MRDYSLGAWESLNYVIRYLEKNDKETSLREIRGLKEQLEEGGQAGEAGGRDGIQSRMRKSKIFILLL